MANLFEDATPADVSFEEMIACVDRELRMRADVYPRWVKSKKIQQEMADRQMLAMRAVRLAILAGRARRDAAEELGMSLDALDDRTATLAGFLSNAYPEPQL